MDLGLLHMDILIMLRVKLNSLGLEQGEDKLGQGGTPGEAMAFEQWWILKLKDLKLVPPGNNPRLPLPQRQLNMLLDQLVKWLLPGKLPSPLLLDLDMDFDLEPNNGFFSFLGLAQAISRARAVGFLSLSVGISQSVGLILYWMG